MWVSGFFSLTRAMAWVRNRLKSASPPRLSAPLFCALPLTLRSRLASAPGLYLWTFLRGFGFDSADPAGSCFTRRDKSMTRELFVVGHRELRDESCCVQSGYGCRRLGGFGAKPLPQQPT